MSSQIALKDTALDIYQNFQTAGFRGEELKKYMDQASYSYTEHGFDQAMKA